ncbi:hypothetical protein CK203_029077 [Vitis vinifera]|uniref:Uncharacterized protein n=1 Tax=Vitis vinifera TaxID=29760 RepID=A0A438IN85_VITVI|nr:hypothetical protein CK203_029077 [Vitis vinifera]
MGSDVDFSSLYLDRSDSVVFGLPGSFMDPHGLARPSLTGCSSRRGHDRLSYGASEIHPAGSALLDTWIPSCLSTWESYGVVSGAWISRVIISEGYDLLRVPLALFSGHQDRSGTSGVILGHISVLDETYGSSWSCTLIPTYEIHVDTMLPPWSLSGVTQLGLHFATPRCHHAFLPGDAPLIYGSDSVVHVDDLDRAFDDGLTFRVIIITSQFRRSEPSSLCSSGVQSHHRFSDRHSESHPRFQHSESLSLLSLTFRVIIITLQFRRSEPSSVFRSTFKVASSVSTFRVVITSQFDVHGHRHYFFQFWRSEPSSLFSLAFRAIIEPSSLFSFGVQSHHYFQFWRSEPSSLLSFGVQSHHYFQFWRSEPSSLFPVLAFRAITIFSFGVQSHHSFSVLAFRAITIFSFGVQSHHSFSVLAFRAIIAFQFWRSEPSLYSVLAFRAITIFGLAFRAIITIFSFGVQSHHSFSVLAFRAITIFSFGVQSHHGFSVLAFRAIIAFQFWCSEPSLYSVLAFRAITIFGLAFRAIITIFSVAFRAIIASQFWRSEPSLYSVLAFRAITIFGLAFRAIITILKPSLYSVLAFRAITIFGLAFRAIITIFSFGVQSHHYIQFWRSEPSLFSVWRSEPSSLFSVWRSEPSSLLSFGIHSHHYFRFRLPEPSLSSCLVPRVGLVIQSHNSWRSCPLALHILPSGFCIRPRLSSLRYLVLIPYSSRTPGWFDRYSSLTLISWVTFRDILEGVWVLDAALESSLHFTRFSHFFFTLVFTFLTLVNSIKEGHICRPPWREGTQVGCSRAEKCGGWQEASGDLLRKTQEKTGEAKQEKREERGLLIAVERGGTRAEWFSGERIVSGIPRHRVERRFSGAAIAVSCMFSFLTSLISHSP